jgi:hypothetical protein
MGLQARSALRQAVGISQDAVISITFLPADPINRVGRMITIENWHNPIDQFQHNLPPLGMGDFDDELEIEFMRILMYPNSKETTIQQCSEEKMAFILGAVISHVIYYTGPD